MKRVKTKFKLGLQRLKLAKCKTRKRVRDPKTPPHPQSPEVARTSTTVSPPQSPLPSSTPLVPELPRTEHDGPKSTDTTQLTSSCPPTQGAAPLVATASTTIHRPATLQGNDTETDVATVDSEPDNTDEIFEDWKPADGLALADGAPIPWLRGKAPPSAAAKFLDDVQEGRA